MDEVWKQVAAGVLLLIVGALASSLRIAFKWLLKLKADLDHAFTKIRALEAQKGGLDARRTVKHTLDASGQARCQVLCERDHSGP